MKGEREEKRREGRRNGREEEKKMEEASALRTKYSCPFSQNKSSQMA